MSSATEQSSKLADSTAGAWRPIDTAPTDGTWVMLYWPKMSMTEFPAVGFSVHRAVWELVDSDDLADPTHWMPLPVPPAPVSGGK